MSQKRHFANLLLITALAAVLRFPGAWERGLSHFDEGVYTIWGVAGSYPGKEFFAPPIYPALVSQAAALVPGSDRAAQCVSLVAGLLTVLLGGLVASRWVGRPAGLATALMIACSSYHIELSQMALTDATFCLWLVCGLAAAREWLEKLPAEGLSRGVWSWLGVHGFFLVLAMNTKYNGGLLLVIPATAAAVSLGVSSPSRSRRVVIRLVTAGGVLAIIAAAGYLPWALLVQRRVGYATLLEHHAGYASGVTYWFDNLMVIFQQQWMLAGIFDRAGALLACLFLGAVCVSVRRDCPGGARNVSRRVFPLFRLPGSLRQTLFWGFSMCGCLAFGASAAWMAAILYCLGNVARSRLVDWIVGSWVAVLLVLTPLYYPYPRLQLPLIVGGIFCWAVAAASRDVGQVSRAQRAVAPVVVLLVLFALLAALTVPKQQRTLREACDRVNESLRDRQGVALFVRPGALVYLQPTAVVLRDLEQIDELAVPPSLLVVDSAILKDNPGSRRWLEQGGQWSQVAVHPYRPPVFVRLDDGHPTETPIVPELYKLAIFRNK